MVIDTTTAAETADKKIRRMNARVVENLTLPGGHGRLRLREAWLAEQAQPGCFVHLECGADLTLRRPFSLMAADPEAGEVTLLYKVVGEGTRRISTWRAGQAVDLLGPIGQPFTLPPPGSRVVLVAGGIGIAPLLFQASALRQQGYEVVLFAGMEGAPLLPLVPSTLPIPGCGQGLGLTDLDALGIPSRVASLKPRLGFHQGYVTELAVAHLEAMGWETGRIHLYACGPTPMLVATARVVNRFTLVGEVSLEEHMACGIGGCGGCVAPIRNGDNAWGYQRVCVDGPVFRWDRVAWEKY